MKKLIIVISLLIFSGNLFAEDLVTEQYYHYKNSIKNILNFENNKDLLIFGAAVLPACFFIDDAVQKYASENGLYSDKVSRIGDLYAHRLGYFAVVSGMVAHDIIVSNGLENSLASIRLIAEGVLAGQIVIEMTKSITRRQRPNSGDLKSFPSGHSGGAFGLATTLHSIYGKKVGIPAYMMAVFVASSRIHDNKHYLSDVVAGGIIGTIIARGFAKQYESQWKIIPQISKNTISINLSFQL